MFSAWFSVTDLKTDWAQETPISTKFQPKYDSSKSRRLKDLKGLINQQIKLFSILTQQNLA